MPKNSKAKSSLLEAYSTLLLTYHGGKSKTEKARITSCANAVYAEYNAVADRTPGTSYSEITGKLTSASSKLGKIKSERIQMANNMVNATRILNSINGVLRLI